MSKSLIRTDSDLICEVIPLANFSAAEVKRFERDYPVMSADQEINLCSEFETPESVRSLGLSTETLSAIEAEFLAVSGWHKARGRDVNGDWYVGRRQALSEKYAGLALAIRAAITAILN